MLLLCILVVSSHLLASVTRALARLHHFHLRHCLRHESSLLLFFRATAGCSQMSRSSMDTALSPSSREKEMVSEQLCDSTPVPGSVAAVSPSSSVSFRNPPIDRGWRAWMTVIGSFFALFCSFGQINAFGTYQDYYEDHQLHELAPSTISWIGSLQLWVFFFSVCVPRGPDFVGSSPTFLYMALGTALTRPILSVTGCFRWSSLRRLWPKTTVGSGLGTHDLQHPCDKCLQRILSVHALSRCCRGSRHRHDVSIY